MGANIILIMTAETTPKVAVYRHKNHPTYLNLPLVSGDIDWRDAIRRHYGFQLTEKDRDKAEKVGTVEGHDVLCLLVDQFFTFYHTDRGEWYDAERYLRVLAGPIPLRPIFDRCFEMAKSPAQQAQTT